jgi:F420-dependent oxidoreductase-like protein
MAQIFANEIRFGVHAGQQNVSYADYLHLWQTVERIGYDWCSVFDHFIPIMTDPEGPCFDGPTLLAALAAHTSRIRCGILVVGNTYRNPAILAKIFTTLDHISGGRVELGIGAGWWELEHEEYGIPFPPVGQRIRMLAESARIITGLWTQHRAALDGRYYTVTDALSEPKPVQQPHPPIWVGGAGERLTLRVVAESADGWNTFFMPVAHYQHKLDVLAEHCRRVGRDPNDIRKSLVIQPVIGESREEVDQRAARIAQARGMSVEDLRRSALVGTPEECAATLLEYVRLGVGDFLVGARQPYDYALLDKFIERVAPIVRREAVGIMQA